MFSIRLVAVFVLSAAYIISTVCYGAEQPRSRTTDPPVKDDGMTNEVWDYGNQDDEEYKKAKKPADGSNDRQQYASRPPSYGQPSVNPLSNGPTKQQIAEYIQGLYTNPLVPYLISAILGSIQNIQRSQQASYPPQVYRPPTPPPVFNPPPAYNQPTGYNPPPYNQVNYNQPPNQHPYNPGPPNYNQQYRR